MQPSSIDPRPRAFAYSRFSSPSQAAGDSRARQTRLAVKYCAEHGLVLDERRFSDFGVSAFRGRNVEVGALGEFLQLVETGAIGGGSYLLVESLDRVSRDKVRKASRVLQDIVEAGIVVVTLLDGREYTAESLDDPMAFVWSIMVAARANEESRTKSERLRHAWSSKRTKAAEHEPMTRILPGWLRLEPGPPPRIAVVEDRAAVVQQIFRDFATGVPIHSIARKLNGSAIPPFGRAGSWHRSYVMKILSNRAVLGEFQPHVTSHAGGKLTRTPQAPIAGYFPQVIEPEVFDKIQRIREGFRPARPRNGEQQNPLAGIARCAQCGGTMTRVNKGARGRPRLVCVQSRLGRCTAPSLVLASVVEAITSGVQLLADDVPAARGLGREELAGIERQIAEVEARIGRLVDVIAGIQVADEGSSEFFARQETMLVRGVEAARREVERQAVGHEHFRHLTARLKAYDGELRKLQEDREATVKRAHAADEATLRLRLRDLASAAGRMPIDPGALNVALRGLFQVIEPASEDVILHWHFGGQSVLRMADARNPPKRLRPKQ